MSGKIPKEVMEHSSTYKNFLQTVELQIFEKMTDLVLVSRSEEEVEEIILPNVPGQLYTFGSEYPGDRGIKDEFIYCSVNAKCIVNPTHFIISVDKHGQFWVQNDTRKTKGKTTRQSVFDTFVNAERVKAVEVRLLKIGDVISVGGTGAGDLRHPCYHITERVIPNSGREFEGGEAVDPIKRVLEDDADSPLANNLIISEIMAYLNVQDLKNARLISKKWRDEASKVLEKKGQVSFTFDAGYRDPKFSTRVSRYLYEMDGLKIQGLHIILKPCADWSDDHPLFLSPGGPGEKMMDDLRKLLKASHNFSSLSLQFDIKTESGFLPFHLIFQELGEKLVELKFKGSSVLFLPDNMPPFPLMTNLKKFTDAGRLAMVTKTKCASLFVPLFAKTLEHFSETLTSGDTEPFYLKQFVKHEMPNLKGFARRQMLKGQSLPLLIQLKTPLTLLKITYSNLISELERGKDCPLLENLLLKHSNSLRQLSLTIFRCDGQKTRIRFPPFPELEELELELACIPRIGWGVPLDYKQHFPSLRMLRIKLLKGWANGQIIPSFFPQGGDVRCETMKDLEVDAFPCPPEDPLFQTRRVEQIRKMFPNAVNINITFANEAPCITLD